MTHFIVNGKPQSMDVEPTTPLLWVLRESLGLTDGRTTPPLTQAEFGRKMREWVDKGAVVRE